ncbi:flagellar basal body rod protein FlgB [Alienimonas sp. DA493]|uniref:flagellar basal body rod protein FlgB n=1 Tax=Alienimonas sp. DA493 TaxID=3373605 RepID=UPI003754E759
MFDSLLSAGSLPLLERQAVWGEVRHNVLAGNLANIDTPGYRPRDLDPVAFQEALRQSVAARTPGAAASLAQAPHDPLAGGVPDELLTAVDRPGGDLVFHDGAPRSIEREALALTRNAMQRQAAIQLMGAQMAMLQAAITERA